MLSNSSSLSHWCPMNAHKKHTTTKPHEKRTKCPSSRMKINQIYTFPFIVKHQQSSANENSFNGNCFVKITKPTNDIIISISTRPFSMNKFLTDFVLFSCPFSRSKRARCRHDDFPSENIQRMFAYLWFEWFSLSACVTLARPASLTLPLDSKIAKWTLQIYFC